MRIVKNLAMAGTLVVGVAGVGIVASAASGPAVATPGSDLSNDIHAGETGEHATANDVDTAKESDVETGAVGNVDVQENETGDHQAGPANEKADPAGDSHTAAGAEGDSGESTVPGAQGSSNQ